MEQIKLVSAENLKTLEDYATSILSSMISLRTLESFELSAYKKGLLDDDQTELSKTICWEIQRLLILYGKQLDSILDKTELTNEILEKSLKKLLKTKPKK